MLRHVLIIDDDRWFADVLRHQLEGAQYMVTCADNGVVAMKKIDDRPPDAIILDIFMPGPDGFALLHELQSYSDLASIPVVLCTNSAPSLPLKALRPYGVTSVLDKTTMSPGDVVAVIGRALWQ